jgi:hypothetical protein
MSRTQKNRIYEKMTKVDKLAITKIDAAIRQLETAITLWFHSGDPVSIATLGYAAYEIIYALNKHRKGPPMLIESENIRPEYQEDWKNLHRMTPNFFKHSGKDPAEVHYFNPESTRFVLFEAAAVYTSWKLENRPLFSLLHVWMLLEYPDIFLESYRNTVKDVIAEREFWLSRGKASFYKEVLPVFSKSVCSP